MASGSTTMKRLIKEVRSLQASPPDGIRVQVEDSDMSSIRGWIQGPSGTPFASGYFLINITFPSDFPALPPKCQMSTRIFHPNVSPTTGEICVSTLKKDWSSTYGVGHILTVIKCLLISPGPDSALNSEAGRLLLEDYSEYERIAGVWTGVHASACPDGLFDERAETTTTSTTTTTTTVDSDKAFATPLQRSQSSNAGDLTQGGKGEDKTKTTSAGGSIGTASSGSPASSLPQAVVASKTAVPIKKANTAAKRGIKRL